MELKRESGILLHPTSFPSRYGIGDLGSEAFQFINFLVESKQSLWQVLPLNPVGFGESPYQCFSAFAGNPLLISIDKLIESGLLPSEAVEEVPRFDNAKVNYQAVKEYKEKLFRRAYRAFKEKVLDGAGGGEAHPHPYFSFLREAEDWLEDYVLFMALKEHFQGRPWNYWDREIALREAKAVKYYRNLLDEEILYHKFLQFIFFSQWQELKQHANQNGIKIVGDIPIFVAHDSSDAWANPHLFQLNMDSEPLGAPSVVAGVPPDYFSETGQLWGNPHYRWDVMADDDYKWWRDRFESILTYVDVVRIDHFRGFEAYWEVPGGEETAVNGRWVKGPGEKFFAVIEKYMGEIPVIAENLGIITPPVEALRKKFKFPGMKVLQFMFETGPTEVFISLFDKSGVIYTGTHDNDTLWSWYLEALEQKPSVVNAAKKYFQIDPSEGRETICWQFTEMVFKSDAKIVITPLQDILCLGNEARMNYPGTVGGNWQWRYRPEDLKDEVALRLGALTEKSGRLN